MGEIAVKREYIYIVSQTLCREREVMVEASNKDEAIGRAKEGYGEIIEEDCTWKLLCSGVARA